METYIEFVNRPEVKVLEELQDALFIANEKKINDFKIIIEKFNFNKKVIENIMEKQMQAILQIKPKLYNSFLSILYGLGFQSQIVPRKQKKNYVPSTLFKIITQDDDASFALQFSTSETFDKLNTNLDTPSGKKAIIQVIIGSHAYKIITYLINNEFFTKYNKDTKILTYAIHSNDDFLIETFLALGYKPDTSSYREAIKAWNLKLVRWMYDVYFYKTSIELVLKAGSVSMLRFFTTTDTQRTPKIPERNLYKSTFQMNKSEFNQ